MQKKQNKTELKSWLPEMHVFLDSVLGEKMNKIKLCAVTFNSYTG